MRAIRSILLLACIAALVLPGASSLALPGPGSAPLELIIVDRDTGLTSVPLASADAYLGERVSAADGWTETLVKDASGQLMVIRSPTAHLRTYVGTEADFQNEVSLYKLLHPVDLGFGTLSPQLADSGWTCNGISHCARSTADQASPWHFNHWIWVGHYATADQYYYLDNCENGSCDTGSYLTRHWHFSTDADWQTSVCKAHTGPTWPFYNDVWSAVSPLTTWASGVVESGKIRLQNGGWVC